MQGLITKQKCFEVVTETVNGQRWIAQTVCERVPGHWTSYSKGAACVGGPGMTTRWRLADRSC